MTVTVIKDLVPASKHGIKCPYEMDAQFITIHNTANDASAENEIKYMNSNNNQVSYHFAVDDKEVIQGLLTNRNGWHCGDGNGPGNRSSIGVEICYSKSGGDRYKKAEALAVKFIAQLLKERGWDIDRVKKHQDWSNKYCPHRILKDGRWDAFKQAIYDELKGKTASKQAVKPHPQTQVKETAVKADMKTNSIVEYLQSIGVNSSFSNRQKLAKQYGISNYKGTAAQNLTLLGKIRNGSVSKTTSKPAPKGDMKTTSVVDYLKSINEDSSFSNRKKLANKHGIKSYSGTATQNTQLLKKLRG